MGQSARQLRFGLALAGAPAIEAVIESRERKNAVTGWGLFLLAAAVCAMMTPFGPQTLLFPFKLSAIQGLGHIGEWQASDFSHLSPFLLALLSMLFVLGGGKVKIPPVRLLLLLVLVWLALTHTRHQMLLGVTAPILLSPALAQTWPAKGKIHPPLFGLLAAFVLVALIAARLMVPVARGDDPVSPVSALAHVPRFVRETPVLNNYGFGGYLIWNGVKVFIDSRADLYGDAFLNDYAKITSLDKDALAATLTSHRIHWTIFPREAQVVKLLDAMPGWQRFYSDKLAVVHVRQGMRP
jgi:hypothetical protein